MLLSIIKICMTTLEIFLYCCAKFPRIDLPSPESYQHGSNVRPTIFFHVDHLIVHFTVRVRFLFNVNKRWQLCESYYDSIVTTKLYIIKYLVMMDT